MEEKIVAVVRDKELREKQIEQEERLAKVVDKPYKTALCLS